LIIVWYLNRKPKVYHYFKLVMVTLQPASIEPQVKIYYTYLPDVKKIIFNQFRVGIRILIWR
jgi:hypothetical protein